MYEKYSICSGEISEPFLYAAILARNFIKCLIARELRVLTSLLL